MCISGLTEVGYAFTLAAGKTIGLWPQFNSHSNYRRQWRNDKEVMHGSGYR